MNHYFTIIHLVYDHTHIILTFFIGKIINTYINTFIMHRIMLPALL